MEILKKLVNSKGRATRKEYWIFNFINFTILLLLGIIEYILGINNAMLEYIYAVFAFVPMLFVNIRRMHDVNKGDLTFLVPVYGFVLLFIDGTRGDNRYGPDPKGRQGIVVPKPPKVE
jgi:uncharacterized membrane protein YhaH (DUF805 family)